MFDNILKASRRLQQTHDIPVSLILDDDGNLDRQCPVPNCLFDFKVSFSDWQEKVGMEAYCPSCGHQSASENWSTPEQQEHFSATALAYVQRELGKALKRDSQTWNSRQPRDGFIRMRSEFKERPRPVLIPPSASELMHLRFQCPVCQCAYSAVGTAYFCPACGHNDPVGTFAMTIANARNRLDSIQDIQSAIEDRDVAEQTVRFLIESGLGDLITAFQHFAERLYADMPQAQPRRRNAFQSLSEGGNLWREATGQSYEDLMAEGELSELSRCFQQRHLLEHTQGIVDEQYVRLTQDHAVRVGQRLVIKEDDMRRYLDLVERLAARLLATSERGR